MKSNVFLMSLNFQNLKPRTMAIFSLVLCATFIHFYCADASAMSTSKGRSDTKCTFVKAVQLNLGIVESFAFILHFLALYSCIC